MIGKVIVRTAASYRPLDLERFPRRHEPPAFGAVLGANGRVEVGRLYRELFEQGGNLEHRRHRIWADEYGKPLLYENYGEACFAVNQHFRAEKIDPPDLMPSHTDLMRTPVPGTVEMGE